MNEESRPARNRLAPKWLMALAVIAAMAAMGRAAQASWQQSRSATLAPGWTEYSLGQTGNIGVLLRVKDQASIADQDWLQVEITNGGPETTISVGSISGGRVRNDGSAYGNMLDGIKIGHPTGVDGLNRTVYTLPAGKLTLLEPTTRLAEALSRLTAGEKFSLHIAVGLRLSDGRSFDGSASASAIWTNPDARELAAAQREMLDLLDQDTAEPSRPSDDPRRGAPPRLSPAQNERLRILIGNSDVAKALTLDRALAVIKLCQDERRSPFFGTGRAILDLINKTWPRDPATVAFYRNALNTRADIAIGDLQIALNVWDDSFVEPLVKAFEAGMLSGSMIVLGAHSSVWAKDASIPPRLSKAVLAHNPVLSRGAAGARTSSGTDLRTALFLLGRTNDPTMISILRPFLADKTPISALPLRISEIASNAILGLLGEPPRYSGVESGIGPSAYPGPNPLWDEWDKQIAELEKRLDALPKP